MFASKSKSILSPKFFIVFIIVILFISIFSISVIANDSDNDKGKSDSKSTNNGKGGSEKDSNDEAEKKEEVKTIIDGQRRTVKVETKTETNGKGEEKTEVKKKIITTDGREIIIKTKTETENGETKTKNSIEIKGVGVETKLSVTEKFEGGQTKLKAKLSTGAEQDIIVMPDEALQTALNELKTTNDLTFEISETVEGNVRKAVFSAKATNPGKLLGIFNVNVNLETLVDTQTGEVIKTNRPWWAFLVRRTEKINVCHIPPGNPENKHTINIAMPALKSHLAHGDSVGECMPICRDGILDEGEICETEINETQSCTTLEGYAGAELCNSLCNGYDTCIATEFCGDGIVNGLETCDDGNKINGDGCNSLCQIEIPTNETIPPSTNQTNITNITI